MPGADDLSVRLAALRTESGSVFVTLADGETFELAPQSVPDGLPEIGGSIDSPLLHEIKLAAERKQVARRLLARLDRRLYPVQRLREKLRDEGFSSESIEAVLEQTAEQGLYSDQVYAEAWCRTCLLTRAVGKRYLVDKLWRKRVPRAVAQAAADTVLDAEREQKLAERAAAARWRRLSGPADRAAEAKVIRFLIGRGFAPGLARQAASDHRPAEDSVPED